MIMIVELFIGGLIGYFLHVPVNKIISGKNQKKGIIQNTERLASSRNKFLLTAIDSLLFVLLNYYYSPAIGLMIFLMVQISMICVFTDIFIRIIANETVLLFLILAIIYRIIFGGLISLIGSLEALLLVIAVFGGSAVLMMIRRGNPGVGAGDLKYVIAIAVAIGFENITWFFIGTLAALVIYCVAGVFVKKMNALTCFPMCLHLSIGFWCALVLPELGLL